MLLKKEKNDEILVYLPVTKSMAEKENVKDKYTKLHLGSQT